MQLTLTLTNYSLQSKMSDMELSIKIKLEWLSSMVGKTIRTTEDKVKQE